MVEKGWLLVEPDDPLTPPGTGCVGKVIEAGEQSDKSVGSRVGYRIADAQVVEVDGKKLHNVPVDKTYPVLQGPGRARFIKQRKTMP